MSSQEDYNLLEMMSKRFKLDDNTVKTSTATSQKQRVGSITANNIQLNELVKLVVNQHQNQRTASISSKVEDEVGLLKSFLSTYQ